jgi:hypothetical protein
MGVASCRSTFLCLILRVRLVLSRFSVRDWSPCHASRIGSCVSWVSISEVARPNPTQPGPALRAPGAHTPHAPPPPLPLSFGFPAQQPPSPSSTSLSPWCPRDWRWRSPEFGPRGELPFPSPLSPSPSPFSSLRPPLSLPCARAPARRGARPCPSPARRRPPRPPPPPRRCSPPPWPRGGARPCPLPATAPPAPAWSARLCPRRRLPCPRRGPCPGAQLPARGVPALGVTRVASFTPLTCSRVRNPTRAVIISGL